MKIAIAVHGRFYAFDFARALLELGHEVTLLTNYPAWAVERFDLPRSRVKSCAWHGVLARAAWRLRELRPGLYPEALVHRAFGTWAASQIRGRSELDVVLAWSGVALELLEAQWTGKPFTVVSRASSHIRTQARLLEAEEKRTGAPQDRPGNWMIAREEREYGRADGVLVLSTFARNSFLEQGVPAEKVALLPLGARLDTFRATPDIVEERCRRVLSGQPLRVLYVGAMSFRKGFWDLAEVARTLGAPQFEFRCVGPSAFETASLIASLRGRVTFQSKVPEASLPSVYAWGDVSLFPTIEDGYPAVLAQAAACGLPVITTPNCSGPDIVREGESGWIVPIRSPEVVVDRLRWCHTNREALAAMIRRGCSQFLTRDWRDAAVDFEALLRSGVWGKRTPGSARVATHA